MNDEQCIRGPKETAAIFSTTMIPKITHIQYLILKYLAIKGESSGEALRKVLRTYELNHSGPKFYQLMARMEKQKYIFGHYKKSSTNGQAIKERFYLIKAEGIIQFGMAQKLYLTNRVR